MNGLLLAAHLLAQGAASGADAAVPLPGELTGCWHSVDGNVQVIEAWMAPSNNMMLGFAETRRDGVTYGWEFLRIERQGGSLVLHALPSGQQPTAFPLAAVNSEEWVFENRDHDFPQRVIYGHPRDGRLPARIEGTDDGGETVVMAMDKDAFDCTLLWQAEWPMDEWLARPRQSG